MFETIVGAVVGPLKTALIGAATNMLVKLFTEQFITDALLYLLRKLSQSTKTQIDDEIYQLIWKRLNEKTK
jgi:hypothetical protein